MLKANGARIPRSGPGKAKSPGSRSRVKEKSPAMLVKMVSVNRARERLVNSPVAGREPREDGRGSPANRTKDDRARLVSKGKIARKLARTERKTSRVSVPRMVEKILERKADGRMVNAEGSRGRNRVRVNLPRAGEIQLAPVNGSRADRANRAGSSRANRVSSSRASRAGSSNHRTISIVSRVSRRASPRSPVSWPAA
jgi:hypothetical protein